MEAMFQFVLNHVTETHGQDAGHKFQPRTDGTGTLFHNKSTANSSAVVSDPYI